MAKQYIKLKPNGKFTAFIGANICYYLLNRNAQAFSLIKVQKTKYENKILFLMKLEIGINCQTDKTSFYIGINIITIECSIRRFI